MGQFARESAVVRIGENRYRGNLCAGWRIGAVPNGGYVLAVAGRALAEVLPHKDPLSISAFYLAPTVLGPIDCEVELLGGGRSTSFAQVNMRQDGQLKVKVTAAFTRCFNRSMWIISANSIRTGTSSCIRNVMKM